ncbi:histone acetyltransferase KAT7-like [Sycon ciliatum]|uniref:histone acetyltransferase KAT7-like n=1 Tax=Sycon ciliatum TaxID=27933 RepID=UPI0031F63757
MATQEESSERRRSSRRLSRTQTPVRILLGLEKDASPTLETPGKRRGSPVSGGPARKRSRSSRSRVSVTSLTTPEGLPITSVLCTYCTGDEDDNKQGKFEALVTCSRCHESAHPSCLPMSAELAEIARTYEWLCFSCKECMQCKSRTRQSKLLLCDFCDRGYHTFCLRPPLKEPPSGDWKCPHCSGEPLPSVTTAAAAMTPTSATACSTERQKSGSPTAGTSVDGIMPLSAAYSANLEKRSADDDEPIIRRPKSTNKMKSPRKSLSHASSTATSNHSSAASSTVTSPKKLKSNFDDILRNPELVELRERLSSGVDCEHVDMFLQSYVAANEQTDTEQACWDDATSSNSAAGIASFAATGVHHPTGTIRSVCVGNYEMETRFSSPYAPDVVCLKRLFLCSFCLVPAKSPSMLGRHMRKCQVRHPPGKEIYRKHGLSVFEVDGAVGKEYCQRLCLLAKLFLHHKTLYHQVEPFRFYVLTKLDESGYQLVGYFSKEKESPKSYNVSCILVLPSHMRQGFGRLLIDLSYHLSQREGKIGSPERPLSDLGLVTYRSYWKSIVLSHLQGRKASVVSAAGSLPITVNIKALSQQTSILMADLISTMQSMGILKYWRGNHIVLLNNSSASKNTQHVNTSKKGSRHFTSIDDKALRWSPPPDPPGA